METWKRVIYVVNKSSQAESAEWQKYISSAPKKVFDGSMLEQTNSKRRRSLNELWNCVRKAVVWQAFVALGAYY